jgi:hypothetical protein
MVQTHSADDDTILNPDFIGFSTFSWSNYGIGKKSSSLNTRLVLALNVFVSIVIIGVTVAVYFLLRYYAKGNYFTAGLLVSLFSSLMNLIYKYSAARFVIWENHKYLKDKDNSFMFKIVVFSTVITNTPIVYTILYP